MRQTEETHKARIRKIAAAIQQGRKGCFMKRKKRATLETVAKLSGFSISTVSRVPSGSLRISPETRREVIRCAARCSYHIESRNVALITYDVENYFSLMLSHLFKELEHQELRPLVISRSTLELLEEIPIRGAISLLSDEGLEHFWGAHYNWPLVCINTPPLRLENIFSVSCDDTQAITQAVKRLHALGHRRIGKICLKTSGSNWNVYRRDQCFTSLAAEYEIIPFSFNVTFMDFNEILKVLRQLLDNRVTALISTSEMVTPLLAQAVELLRISIPEQLSIIAWSTGEFDGFYSSWETFRQDYDTISRKAVKTLQTLFAGGIPKEADQQIAYQIHSGCSLAPPPLQ